MTIFWQFYNTPQKKMFCRVSLRPSVSDYDFSFNLAAHKKGDITWTTASQNFISGEQAGGLFIESQPGQSIILLIKDNDGNQKRRRFSIDDYWISEGDVDCTNTIVDCKKLFEKNNFDLILLL